MEGLIDSAINDEEVSSMITLEAARVNIGLTIEEAAKLLGVHRDTLWKYEQNSTNVKRTFMLKAQKLYGVAERKDIFFGEKSEFFRMKRRLVGINEWTS